MSSVVINSSKVLGNQRVKSIDSNRVFFPFNVSKGDATKLVSLLSKISVKFFYEPEKLEIERLSYNGINIKKIDRKLNNNKMTLAKTYVVTMKNSFISKVREFYGRVVEKSDVPVFSITKELNLQEALQEATMEIDLSTLNQISQQKTQVLANNPAGDTVIENPVNLDNNVEQPAPIVETQEITQTPVVNGNVELPQKVKSRKLSGKVFVVPVIIVWLGLVLVGTIKAVTAIMS